jgi:putative ABC transport system permease protein
MNFFVTLRVSLRALTRNKMRASLTILGVVIGISAVTTLVSLGQSAHGLVQKEFDQLGTNVIVVFPGSRNNEGAHSGPTPTLTSKDSDAIGRECPSVLAASPLIGFGGQVIYGNSNFSPREMYGVGPDYPLVRNWPLRSGGFFTEREITSAAKVCVIGHTLVARLFQTANPMGQTIRIKNIPFEVIGVLERKGANMVGEDQDDIILMPYSTVRKRLFGSEFDNVNVVLVSARSLTAAHEADAEITQLLAERHRILPGEPFDFTVQDTAEIAAILGRITGTLTLMLAAIAAISMLVGGVGIMNIMLVSVTERTREIGVRKAVGAKRQDILVQFLIEAVVLSLVGGALGLAAGYGIGVGVASLLPGDWPPAVVPLWAVVLAFGFSVAVGIFFGIYPAGKASRLDPIEALRYE